MVKKKLKIAFSKLMCALIILSLFAPNALGEYAYGGKYEDKYNLQMKTGGIVKPFASTNPFTVEKNEKVNIAVEVADENATEYTFTDDFDDEQSLYTDVVWEVEGEGVSLDKTKGSFVGVTGLKSGKHFIVAKYARQIDGRDVKPLRIEVNVRGDDTTSGGETPKSDESEEDGDANFWNFEASTNTLKGFKDKNNHPIELKIPKTIGGVQVKHIGDNAFKFSSYSSSLKNKLTKITIPEGVESIGVSAFQGNDIPDIKIPASVTDIKKSAFQGNKLLSSVVFAPQSKIDTLRDSVFYGCNITNINIPDTVTNIEQQALKENPIKSINLPRNISKIGGQAFAWCSIEELTIPAGVTQINKNARGTDDTSGVFFRNIRDFARNGSSVTGKFVFTKIYDEANIATVSNTRGVVNPKTLTIEYKNERGESIADSVIATGYEKNTVTETVGNYGIKKAELAEGDKHFYTDYVNPFNDRGLTVLNFVYSKAENIIGENYFAVGKSYEIPAKDIDGYIAPPSVTKEIASGENKVTFVYKQARKAQITTIGQGISHSAENGQIDMGREIAIRVLEPEKKSLIRLNINGEDVKSQAVFNGIFYEYRKTIQEDTAIEAVYEESQKTNTLSAKVDSKDIFLGDKAVFSVWYRGEKIENLDKLNIDITTEGKTGAVEKENDKAKVLVKEAGKCTLSVSAIDYPNIKENIELEVKPVNVKVRMEAVEGTKVPEVDIAIDKLYVNQGVEYYKDVEFSMPVPFLAMEKALKNLGINTADKNEFDSSSDGNWMITLGRSLGWQFQQSGSYMYYVNDVFANSGVGSFNVNNGDRIVIYYDPNWQNPISYSFFENSKFEIFEGESATFVLKGFKYESGGLKELKIEGAKLNITGDENILSDEKTDSEGRISHVFNKPGKYKVSAVAGDGNQNFSRPYGEVIVKEKPKTNEIWDENGSIKVKLENRVLEGVYKVDISEKADKEAFLDDIKQQMYGIMIVGTADGKEVALKDIIGENKRATVELKLPNFLANEEYLKLFYRDANSGKWIDVSHLKSKDKIIFETDHFSDWIIGAEKKLTVFFNSYQGAAISNQIVKYGDKISAPAVLQRDGYKFEGWYIDEKLTQPWNFESDQVLENMTLYGKWQKSEDLAKDDNKVQAEQKANKSNEDLKSENKEKKTTVKTGDRDYFHVWIISMMLSLLMGFAIINLKKKQ